MSVEIEYLKAILSDMLSFLVGISSVENLERKVGKEFKRGEGIIEVTYRPSNYGT